MKTKNMILRVLMYLPVVITFMVLSFMPDKVPAHYDLAGNVTRWGSKYELLITPIITIGMGYFFILMAKYVKKKNEGNVERDEKILIIVGITIIVWNNILSGVFIYKAATLSMESTSGAAEFDLLKFLAVGIGAILVVLGNIMPKVSRNKIIGVRTKWSLANDRAWFLTQRMSAKLMVLSGLIMIFVCGIVLKGIIAFVFANVCVMVCCIISVAYSKACENK